MTKYILIAFSIICALTLVPAESYASRMIELMEVEQPQPRIAFAENVVHVSSASNQTLYVYNVAGVCIQSFKIESADKRIELNLPKGCYILKIGKTVRKITIK